MDACAYFSLHGYEKEMLFKIEGGDFIGKSMKISAISMYHDFEIPLKVNRLIHKGHITSEQYHNYLKVFVMSLTAICRKRNIFVVRICSGIKRCFRKEKMYNDRF